MPPSAPSLAACRSLLSLIVAALLVAPVELAARAEPPPRGISARDFLARVGRSHPSLPVLEAAVEEAAANVRAARVWANPSLSYDREEVFAGGRAQPENYLRLELPLEVSGRRGLRVQAARLGLEAVRAGAVRDRTALLLDALGLYWSAAAARETASLLQRERAALGGLLKAVRSRTSAGETSGYDRDRLELELDAVDDSLAEAGRELELWQRRLGLLAGEPAARLDASDALTLPGRPRALEGLLRQALAARADHRAARLRAAQAERELAAAGRGWVPGLVLSGGLKTAAVDERTAWGYLAGLSLGLPVLDHGQGEAAKARARLRLAQAEQHLLEAQVLSEVTTTHGALTRTLAQAERFERTQLPRLERLVRRAQVSYQEGERPVFELLDALRTARGVRARGLALRRTARQSELDLARALGGPLP